MGYPKLAEVRSLRGAERNLNSPAVETVNGKIASASCCTTDTSPPDVVGQRAGFAGC
jgi:hypothetical protein